MVIGQYSSTISVGNRVTFPKKFSDELGKSYLITKGLDGNLIMVSASDKYLLLEGIETKPYVSTTMRERQAFVLGNTFDIELDKLNRFVIPSPLFIAAGMSKEVLFAAIGDFIQLWEVTRWEAFQKTIQLSITKTREGEST